LQSRPVARAGRDGASVIEHDLRTVRYLRQALPDDWEHAAAIAAELAATTRYLPWADRARAFDDFFWAEARRRLSSEDVTAIVNRKAALLAEPGRVDGYTRFCAAVVAAALLQLDEPVRVENEAAALVHFLSAETEHRDAALDWIGAGHHLGFDRHLPSWPGCAFLLLIRSPSDSAESFLARDAFWAAMLGRA
jgi:hypothetical protein